MTGAVADNTSRANRFPARAYRQCATLAAIFLLTMAALLKLGFDGSPLAKPADWSTSSLAVFELASATWLSTGVWHRPARAVVGMLFCTFAAYQVWALFTHQGPCGCFGRLDPPPGLMALLDLSVGAGLLWPEANRIALPPPRIIAITVITQFIAFLPSAVLTSAADHLDCINPVAIDRHDVLRGNPVALSALGMSDARPAHGRLRLFVVVDPGCGHCRSFVESLVPHLRRWGDTVSVQVVSIAGSAQGLLDDPPPNVGITSVPRCVIWTDKFPFLFMDSGGRRLPRMVVAEESPPQALPLLCEQLD